MPLELSTVKAWMVALFEEGSAAESKGKLQASELVFEAVKQTATKVEKGTFLYREGKCCCILHRLNSH